MGVSSYDREEPNESADFFGSNDSLKQLRVRSTSLFSEIQSCYNSAEALTPSEWMHLQRLAKEF